MTLAVSPRNHNCSAAPKLPNSPSVRKQAPGRALREVRPSKRAAEYADTCCWTLPYSGQGAGSQWTNLQATADSAVRFGTSGSTRRCWRRREQNQAGGRSTPPRIFGRLWSCDSICTPQLQQQTPVPTLSGQANCPKQRRNSRYESNSQAAWRA